MKDTHLTLRLPLGLARELGRAAKLRGTAKSEILHGCHRAADPGTQARRFAFVEALFDLVPVYPFGLAEARRHADLWARLARDGMPIGAHDMLIGATALASGHTLATLNARDFRRVPGLRLLAVDQFVSV